MSFDRRSLKRVALPIAIKIVLAGERVSGTTRDISPKGLCLEIPSARIKTGFFGLLNTNVIIQYENEMMDGTIRWYTLEESTYQIGVSIERSSKALWKKIIDHHLSQELRGVAKPA